jgi:hypothetical protein
LNSRLRSVLVLGLTIAVVGSTSVDAQTTNSKISPDLAANPTSGNVQVIVQYYNPPSAGAGGLLGGVLGLVGGLVKAVLGTIDALVEVVPYGNLNSIAADPNVKYISPDRTLGARQTASIPSA